MNSATIRPSIQVINCLNKKIKIPWRILLRGTNTTNKIIVISHAEASSKISMLKSIAPY
ncbi:hypothetical protein JCM14036_18420 [Desulfotomaculum defluvii]